MKIELLFFAQLKEAVGSGHKTLEVEDGTTIDEVVASLREWPEWASVSLLPLSFAVNERIVAGGQTLRDGDRLALLTPISGG